MNAHLQLLDFYAPLKTFSTKKKQNHHDLYKSLHCVYYY